MPQWPNGLEHIHALPAGTQPGLPAARRGHLGRGKAGERFAEKQREAFDLVRAAIDRGLPCYGWQMEAPDYYLITGYDDVGYYYAGAECEEGRGPLPWEKLATWDVDLLEVYQVEPVPPAPAEKTVKEALEFALRHAQQSAEWVNPIYRSGPAGSLSAAIRSSGTGSVEGPSQFTDSPGPGHTEILRGCDLSTLVGLPLPS